MNMSKLPSWNSFYLVNEFTTGNNPSNLNELLPQKNCCRRNEQLFYDE